MKLLEERIKKDGKILEDGKIIKVDSFLNHQLDIQFLEKLGDEMYAHFLEKKVNKILTIEASGIALATVVSQSFNGIPVVFAKKQRTKNIGDNIYTSEVKSYTTGKEYTITVSKEYLNEGDRLLIIDDFLAEGQALRGLIDISNKASAHICGLSVAVEKGFQGGGDALREDGYDLLSLAIIDSVKDNKIEFRR